MSKVFIAKMLFLAQLLSQNNKKDGRYIHNSINIATILLQMLLFPFWQTAIYNELG